MPDLGQESTKQLEEDAVVVVPKAHASKMPPRSTISVLLQWKLTRRSKEDVVAPKASASR